MGLGNETVHNADSSHVTINRFGKNERQRYLLVGNAIKELAKRADEEFEQHLKGEHVQLFNQP
jgi:hypothetical protein